MQSANYQSSMNGLHNNIDFSLLIILHCHLVQMHPTELVKNRWLAGYKQKTNSHNHAIVVECCYDIIIQMSIASKKQNKITEK